MSEFIGNPHVLTFFDTAIQAGRLSHAYCLVGPEQVGKKTAAIQIAAKLLGVPLQKVLSHPDFVLVEQEMNDKTGKTKKNIDVDQIRDVIVALSRRPFMGKYNVAIIDDADKMNISAANALLKTLEEPSAQTVIFLLARNDERLAPTIRSRCQTMYFGSVKTEIIEEALRARSCSEVKNIVAICSGLPGRAIAWTEQPELFLEYKKEVERFSGMIGLPFHAKVKVTDDLFGDKTDANLAREKLLQTMEVWETSVHDVLTRTEKGECIGVWNVDVIVRVWKKILEAKQNLFMNMHPRLVVEQILLELP